eukprot:5746615-Prymnesium_polylepis.1
MSCRTLGWPLIRTPATPLSAAVPRHGRPSACVANWHAPATAVWARPIEWGSLVVCGGRGP